jgi:hypothetical protein
MKKIRSAELLVAVAIVTSATVMLIREYTQSQDMASANAHAAMSSCSTTRDGLMPARCELMRGERRMEHDIQPQHDARQQLWV